MDANRFDRLSRSLARRMSRRQAVQALGIGGVASSTALGGAPLVASSQADGETCLIDLIASVQIGPSAGDALGGANPGELAGQLRFSGSDLSDAVFTLANGTEMEASGESQGQSITIRIAIPLGGTLVLIGAAGQPFEDCEGPADGLFTGPQPGDIGDWHGMFSDAPAGDQEISNIFAAAQSPTPAAAQSPTATSIAGAPEPTAADGACRATGESCQGAECCSSITDCINGICACRGALGSCAPQLGVACCEGLICAANACCLADGMPCVQTNECCNWCNGGFCSQTPPEACGELGGPCNSQGVCCGNAWCDAQDLPGTCRCQGSGEPCAQIGTGACCSNQPCNEQGQCP